MSEYDVDSPWMTIIEAAKYARSNTKTVGDALRDGSLRGYQTGRGGKWRIHRDDVNAWLRGEDPVSAPPRVTRRRSA